MLFLHELSFAEFHNIYNITDPTQALDHWYKLFLHVLNKHAPIKRRRVKHPTLPPWFTKNIQDAMSLRDELRQKKKFDEYKKQRNHVTDLVREAKKSLAAKMINESESTRGIWDAINMISGKKKANHSQIPQHLTPNTLNTYFTTIADTLAHSCATDPNTYVCSDQLLQHCKAADGTEMFSIPPITVFEVGKIISSIKTKSCGLDGIKGVFSVHC